MPPTSRRNFRELYGELRSYQGRLGTGNEQPGDLEQVLGLAHELNNQIAIEYGKAVCQSPAGRWPELREVRKRLVSTRPATT